MTFFKKIDYYFRKMKTIQILILIHFLKNKLEMNFKPNKHEFYKLYKILRMEICRSRKEGIV